MQPQNEYEIVHHTAMNHLEFFLVELSSRNAHGHSDLEIGIILEGSVELILENQRIVLHKHEIYVINHYQIHSFINTGERNLVLALQISSKLYKHLGAHLTRLRFENLIETGTPLYDHLFQTLLQCAKIYYQEEQFSELKCASLMFEALHVLALSPGVTLISEKEQSAAHDSSLRLNRILEYMAEHYHEPILLKDIADLENISSYHVSHFIKERLGISFQDYLNILRFEHAYPLVTQTSLNILDICIESGFSSSRYLNQMFRKYFGCTAAEYRRQNKTLTMAKRPLPTKNLQRRLSFEAAKEIIMNISDT